MQNTKIVFEAERLSQDFKIATNDRPLAHFNLKAIGTLLDGVKPRFHIIAGEPAAGKSTLLLQMADDLASQGQLVLFFTLEMHPSQLLKKSLSRMSAERAHDDAAARPLDLASISDALRLAQNEQDALSELCIEYGHAIAPRIAFIDKGVTPMDIGILVSRCRQELGVCPVVFIDYLQILQPNVDDTIPSYLTQLDETQAVRNVTKNLRYVIDKHHIPAYVASSINRVSYGKEASSLGALASSSALEYEADSVVFMTVEGQTPKERIENMTRSIRPIKLSVLKHRYAPPSSASVFFDAKHARFVSEDCSEALGQP